MTEFAHNDKNFPVLFESREYLIYKNPSDEVFIYFERSGATLRFSGDKFTFGSDVEIRPREVNGLSAYSVLKRKV